MDDALRTVRIANVCAVVVDIEPTVSESVVVELLLKLKDVSSLGAKSNRSDYVSRLAALIFHKTDMAIASKVVEEGKVRCCSCFLLLLLLLRSCIFPC